ncbi:Zn-dependent alcohol dehydrogenase [Sphingomonas paucimobilis]|nr:Zn-dependent alcohol dehydrogenase [Sphingomonas paucimobilis]
MARAIVFDAPGSAILEERDLAPPAAGEIAVEADVSLVSAGTERSLLTKFHRYPVEPGYSMAGHVTAVGPDVTAFAPGDRVIVHSGHASATVIDQRFALRIPANVASEDAAFFTIGAMAVYTIRLAALDIGSPLLILGQGLIGLVTTQVARIAGAAPLIVTDVVQERLDLARELGADHGFRADQSGELAALARSLPGGGPAATIDLSGMPSTIETALALTRRGGRVIPASMIPGGHQVDIFGRAWIEGLSIVGAYFNARPWSLDATEVTSPLDWPVRPYSAGRLQGTAMPTSLEDAAIFLRLLENGRIKLDRIVTEAVDADDAPAMFMRLPQSDALGSIIRWR